MLSPKILSLCLCITFAACQSLTDALGSQSDLSQLATILQTTGLISSIPSPPRGLTVLAPTNDALTQLLASPNAPNLDDRLLVANLINYHLLNGTLTSDQIPSDALGAIAPTFLVNENVVLLNGTPQVVNFVSSDDGVTVYSGGRAASAVEEAVRITHGSPS